MILQVPKKAESKCPQNLPKNHDYILRIKEKSTGSLLKEIKRGLNEPLLDGNEKIRYF